MPVFLQTLLTLTALLLFLSCNQVTVRDPLPPATVAVLPSVPIPKDDQEYPEWEGLPQMTGEWEGVGKDQGRTFLWERAHSILSGTYLGKKNEQEDYSKVFCFRNRVDSICCYPVCYKCDCGTPDATYRLQEQTDSSVIFLTHHYKSKRVSTITFSFTPLNRMTLTINHNYSEYPALNITRHFVRQ